MWWRFDRSLLITISRVSPRIPPRPWLQQQQTGDELMHSENEEEEGEEDEEERDVGELDVAEEETEELPWKRRRILLDHDEDNGD